MNIKEYHLKKTLLLLSCALLAAALALSGCKNTEYITVTNTTTLPASTVTTTATETTATTVTTTSTVIDEDNILDQIALSDESVIYIPGTGSFYYQRFEGAIDEDIIFHDVIFTNTVIETFAAIRYCITTSFQDGTSEYLMFGYLQSDCNGIYFNFTQYDNPQTGVMMILYDNPQSGEQTLDLYIMVEKTE